MSERVNYNTIKSGLKDLMHRVEVNKQRMRVITGKGATERVVAAIVPIQDLEMLERMERTHGR